MVVYNLACDNAHHFEGWFASPQAFDQQAETDAVSCPVCGSSGVVRQPSAPYISKRGEADKSAEMQASLLALQAKILNHVMNNTEDVGKAFPDEARRIHQGDAPERAIRGQATRQQATALREEGIEVFALPVAPVPPDQLH